jgi:hypothetical protein
MPERLAVLYFFCRRCIQPAMFGMFASSENGWRNEQCLRRSLIGEVSATGFPALPQMPAVSLVSVDNNVVFQSTNSFFPDA